MPEELPILNNCLMHTIYVRLVRHEIFIPFLRIRAMLKSEYLMFDDKNYLGQSNAPYDQLEDSRPFALQVTPCT